MAGSNIPIDVYMYVNPETRVVDELYCIHPWGLSRRENGDWEPIDRDESNLDQLEDYYVYDLDWSTDYAAIDDDSVDDDEEHAAIAAFDNDTLDEEGAKKYGILIIDPTADFDQADFNSEDKEV